MNKMLLFKSLVTFIVLLGMTSYSYAGSDRMILSMSAERMDQEDLTYVRFLGPDGAALESNILKQMVIREQDCISGSILEIVSDYKIGYAPENMLVGVYLYPQAWNNKTLCFSVPDFGEVKQSLNPATNNGRLFQLNIAP